VAAAREALDLRHGRGPARPGPGRRLLRLLRNHPLGLLGLAIIAGFVVVGVFGPSLAPYDPRTLHAGKPLAGMSAAHWFGTNSLGQDIYSRVLAGARISLIISSASVVIGSTLGALMGTLCGFKAGWLDFTLQRISEAFVAFPNFIIYLMLITAFGRGPLTIICAIAVGALFGGHRVVRSATFIVASSGYVQAARSIGCSETRIFFRYVVPNLLPIGIVLISGGIGGAILAESTLAFLGLGLAPGSASWGIDMSGQNLTFAALGHWNLVVFPGAAISLVVLGANLLGDSLRDLLDPRMRHSRAG